MLKISHLHKSFGVREIINDFNFEFTKGKLYGIAGPSGSGKSTLLNIIGMIDQEFDGDIFLFNKPYKAMRKREVERHLRENFSYLFQNYALIDDLSVIENLKLVTDDKGKMIDSMNRVGLDETFLDSLVFTLSGGEQQRVALSRCLLKASSIVLADEPTGNLDGSNRDMVIKVLRILAAEGKCVIIVSHDPLIIDMCDEVIELKKVNHRVSKI